MVEDDVTHVADLPPHLGLPGLCPHGGEGPRVWPAVTGVVFAEEDPREGLVKLVGEGVEGLLLVVALHFIGPQGLLVANRVKQSK